MKRKSTKGLKKNVHPNSKANLILFKKGVSGNPNGRPKKIPKLIELIEDTLGVADPDNPEQSEMHTIVNALKKLAKQGNVLAAKELLDRAYGKPHQSIGIRGEGDTPQQITGFVITTKHNETKDDAQG
jgi:hypothetical protein